MFVAALILYLFGSGAVRGFAVSLGLGILTSVITAVTMTRMMIALWYRRKPRRCRYEPPSRDPHAACAAAGRGPDAGSHRPAALISAVAAGGQTGARRRLEPRTMKLLRLAPENTKISFMRFRRISYPLSARALDLRRRCCSSSSA